MIKYKLILIGSRWSEKEAEKLAKAHERIFNTKATVVPGIHDGEKIYKVYERRPACCAILPKPIRNLLVYDEQIDTQPYRIKFR